MLNNDTLLSLCCLCCFSFLNYCGMEWVSHRILRFLLLLILLGFQFVDFVCNLWKDGTWRPPTSNIFEKLVFKGNLFKGVFISRYIAVRRATSMKLVHKYCVWWYKICGICWSIERTLWGSCSCSSSFLVDVVDTAHQVTFRDRSHCGVWSSYRFLCGDKSLFVAAPVATW